MLHNYLLVLLLTWTCVTPLRAHAQSLERDIRIHDRASLLATPLETAQSDPLLACVLGLVHDQALTEAWSPFDESSELAADLDRALRATLRTHAEVARQTYEICASTDFGLPSMGDRAAALEDWDPRRPLPTVGPPTDWDDVRRFHDARRLRRPPMKTWRYTPQLTAGPLLFASVFGQFVLLRERTGDRRHVLGLAGISVGALLGLGFGRAWRRGSLTPLLRGVLAWGVGLALGALTAFAPRASQELRVFGQSVLGGALADAPLALGAIARVVRCRRASTDLARRRQCAEE